MWKIADFSKERRSFLEFKELHEWPESKIDALEIQREMADRVEIFSNVDDIKSIAAVDTAYGQNSETIYVATVVVTFPEIEVIEKTFQYDKVKFPYIPGLFYFREGSAIIKALTKIQSEPDMLIIHGHGITHPRHCGMASQIGIGFDKPTIGCARKLLVGYYQQLPLSKGSCQPIVMNAKKVGYAYRSKDKIKPIFVSPGHLCTIDEAKDITVKCLRGYRFPEPLRLAHLFANKYKRHMEKKVSFNK